jgi:hypothetical protein
MELALWPRCAYRGIDFHLVGARFSRHHEGRTSVAGYYDHLLFYLGPGGAQKKSISRATARNKIYRILATLSITFNVFG